MRKLRLTSVLAALCLGFTAAAQEAPQEVPQDAPQEASQKTSEIDMGNIIFSHIEDAYE